MTKDRKVFEDFAIGDAIALGRATVTRADIIAFAETFDPAPMHCVDGGAKAAFSVEQTVAGPERISEIVSPLAGIVASNWHVGALFMRAFYDSLLAGSSSRGAPGIEWMDWPNPVYPDDELTFGLEVMDIKASRSRPDMGLVLFDMVGWNQHGAPVIRTRSWTMFGRRETANVV